MANNIGIHSSLDSGPVSFLQFCRFNCFSMRLIEHRLPVTSPTKPIRSYLGMVTRANRLPSIGVTGKLPLRKPLQSPSTRMAPMRTRARASQFFCHLSFNLTESVGGCSMFCAGTPVTFHK
ncbi:hypothetical protein PtB15_18B144 [Puccinia triticina]|nr:hypothetical protein PtB15_18B144 [Puccinia triticina]